MAFIKEFKKFAVQGNVVDLAIAFVIGGAFSKIINSLVDDVITPALLTPALKAAHLENLSQLTVPGTAIKYGNFLSTCISFILVALVLFLLIKGIIASRKKEAKTPQTQEEMTVQEKLLTEIRDALKK